MIKLNTKLSSIMIKKSICNCLERNDKDQYQSSIILNVVHYPWKYNYIHDSISLNKYYSTKYYIYKKEEL